MIKLDIQKGKEHFKRDCPTSWDEVTVRQYIQFESDWNGKDLVKLMSILTGLDVETISNSKGNVINQLTPIITFVQDSPPDFKKLPKKDLLINGKTIKMPKKLEQETFGQMSELYKILEDKEDIIKHIPRVMAIYAQPQLEGAFNKETLDKTEELINDLPAVLAYPHCFFFYNRAQTYKATGILT